MESQFVLEDKYIYVSYNGRKYSISSPYLKVLKAKHEFKNKNYLIVQLDQDLDVDEKIEEFIRNVRNMDEYSKEILMKNSKNWYGKKWDIYTLDSMTRYPIDEQKGVIYMKMIIDKEDKELNRQIDTLEKIVESNHEVYISVDTYFKGLRWSREVFTEEWYLSDFRILEEERDMIETIISRIHQPEENHVEHVEHVPEEKVEEVEQVERVERVQEEKVEDVEPVECVEHVERVEHVQEEKVEDVQHVEHIEQVQEEEHIQEHVLPHVLPHVGQEEEDNDFLPPKKVEDVRCRKKSVEEQSIKSSGSKRVKKVFTFHGKHLK